MPPVPLDMFSAVVDYHAQALAPADREAFTQAVYERLTGITELELGPGLVNRIIREVQPGFVDQQVIGSGPRRPPMAKYARPLWILKRGKLKVGAVKVTPRRA